MALIREGFITVFVLGHSLLLAVRGQQCSSTNRTIYLKSPNGDLRSQGYDTQLGLTLDQCSKKCTDEQSVCNSFTYDKAGQKCLLRSESAQPFGSGILSGGQQGDFAFYQRICIQSDRICNIVGVFDWYPQFVLVGFSMEVLRASSTSECLQLCLEFGAVNKVCKSTMYFYDTNECVVNSESRASRPALFGNDTQGFVVDYFDNNCAVDSPMERPAVPITCTAPAVPRYTLVEDQELTPANGQNVQQKAEYVVRSQNVDESVCRTLCDNNKDEVGEPVRCRGYSYDTVSRVCYLSSDLASPRGEATFVDRRSFNYYEKVCLSYANQCPQPAFTRYPDHVLVGYAREVYRYSMVADCLDACLNSRTVLGFDCLSVMYYYETGECVVNSATKRDQPALFSGDTQALEADYFENNCVAGKSSQIYPPTVAPYQPPPLITASKPPAYEIPPQPATLRAPPPPPEPPSSFVPVPAPPPPPHPPVILPPGPNSGRTGTAPSRLPVLNNNPFVVATAPPFTSFEPTRVFIFPASDSSFPNSQFFAHPNPNFNSSPNPTPNNARSPFGGLGVSSECLLDSVRVTVTFPQPTTGAVFVKHQFSTCRKTFGRSLSTVFDVPLRGPTPPGVPGESQPASTVQAQSSTIQRCEATLIGINKYSWVIVVQQNEINVPSLMTGEDQIFNVTCDYSEAFTKVAESATFLPVGRVPATELDSKQIPKPDAKISMELLRDGIPVTMVLLGEELELRWRIDSTTPNVAFFVHDCLAERVGGSPPEPAPLRLISDGCPDPSISGRIMTSPVIQLSAGLSTRMTMFRFDGSRSVKIKCAIDMCVQRCRPVRHFWGKIFY